MIKTQTRSFQPKSGGQLHCRSWQLDAPGSEFVPRALVFISHGFSEHLGYYETLGNALAQENILAFGHDHRGHGLSDGKRAYIDRVDTFVDDLVEHCQALKKQHPHAPLYLVGHSMGGMIVLKAVIEYPNLFQGMVLQGPLIIPGPDLIVADARLTPLRAMLVKSFLSVLDWWNPEMVLGDQVMGFITSDPEMQKSLNLDELRWKSGMKVRSLIALVDCMLYNMGMIGGIRIPFLTLHGKLDKLCNVAGSRFLHQRAGSDDKEIQEFENANHQLYLEVPAVRDESLAKTVSWIVNHLD